MVFIIPYYLHFISVLSTPYYFLAISLPWLVSNSCWSSLSLSLSPILLPSTSLIYHGSSDFTNHRHPKHISLFRGNFSGGAYLSAISVEDSIHCYPPNTPCPTTHHVSHTHTHTAGSNAAATIEMSSSHQTQAALHLPFHFLSSHQQESSVCARAHHHWPQYPRPLHVCWCGAAPVVSLPFFLLVDAKKKSWLGTLLQFSHAWMATSLLFMSCL